MSGVGKTRLANLLRDQGDWFHYSVDYRIGTRYMGEHIVDNFKREAMKQPVPARIADDGFDLHRLQHHLRQSRAALHLSRQARRPGEGRPSFRGIHAPAGLHRRAEINALLDASFIERARDLYGYRHFLCDTGGSICEVVDPDDPEDPVLTALTAHTMLLVWIRGTDAHTEELVRRFARTPKPMYYQPDFLRHLGGLPPRPGLAEDAVDPDAFMRCAYAAPIAHRRRSTPRWRGAGASPSSRGDRRAARCRRGFRRHDRRALPLRPARRRLCDDPFPKRTAHAHQDARPSLPAFDVLRARASW
jgi:hypothetical protein